MKILSIETSCDDTGISIMEAKGGIGNPSFKVLANNLASQTKIHIPYGGVYPVLAKREHMKNLPIVLEKTFKETKIKTAGQKPPVDLIAVTHGPGLEMCLWEGITFAQNLAKKWNIPIIPVNHMEGHMFSVFGKNKGSFKIPKIKSPILILLVSGGHTQLILSKKRMQYEIIGESVDDAVGEAFDKVARMLGLPYPGGPEISRLAEIERQKKPSHGALRTEKNFAALPASGLRHGLNFPPSSPHEHTSFGFSFALPRPMLHSKDLNFSFSGLKTAVLYLLRKIGKLDKEIKSKIALEFENAAIECLTYKTAKAIEKYGIKTLLVGGGVAANKHLRKEMRKITGHAKGQARKKIKLFFPTPELSTDNSIMIGIAGYLQYLKRKGKFKKGKKIKAMGNLELC